MSLSSLRELISEQHAVQNALNYQTASSFRVAGKDEGKKTARKHTVFVQ
jgi:hypothetical protein